MGGDQAFSPKAVSIFKETNFKAYCKAKPYISTRNKG